MIFEQMQAYQFLMAMEILLLMVSLLYLPSLNYFDIVFCLGITRLMIKIDGVTGGMGSCRCGGQGDGWGGGVVLACFLLFCGFSRILSRLGIQGVYHLR